MILFLIITLSLFILTTVAVYNFFTAPVFRKSIYKEVNPFISVLIPARNEEENLAKCLEALAVQDYMNFEIIIGNDNSEDNTVIIAERFSKIHSFIKKIDIPSLPAGWLGKNHAAHHLYKEAKGEMLLFLDADVKLDENALSSAAYYLDRHKADLLSVFPSQEMETVGEKMVVPLLNFFLLTMLPLKQVLFSRNKKFIAAIGQFMLFRRDAYKITGGHENVKYLIAEDLALASKVKNSGLRVVSMLDGGLVSCRMYDSFRSAVEGFTKNFFKGSSLSFPLFFIFLSIFFLIFFLPFAGVLFSWIYLIPLSMILLIRGVIAVKSGQNSFHIFLHPLQIIILYFIGLRSLALNGSVSWKGRKL